jgi:hypothetical protein
VREFTCWDGTDTQPAGLWSPSILPCVLAFRTPLSLFVDVSQSCPATLVLLISAVGVAAHPQHLSCMHACCQVSWVPPPAAQLLLCLLRLLPLTFPVFDGNSPVLGVTAAARARIARLLALPLDASVKFGCRGCL